MFKIGKESFILESLKPIIPQLFSILFLVLLWTCFETFLLYTLKEIVDSFSLSSFSNINLFYYFCAFVIIIIFIEVPMRIANFLHARVLPRAAQIIRENLTEKLLNKDISFFSNEKLGDLVSRVAGLPQAIENIVKVLLYGIIAGSFSFLVTIVLISLNLANLALYFLLWYLLMGLVGIYFIKRTINLSQNFAHGINMANAELTEGMQNILNIKTAAKEDFELSRMKNFFYNVLQSQTELEMLSFKADMIRSIISGILLIGLFGFVLLKISEHNATLGDLIFVISSAFIARRDIWRVSLQLTEIYKNFGFIKEVEILTKNETQEIGSNQKALKNIKSIKFDSISFGFTLNSLILKDISFEIKEGTKVALVGSSGAGKTTLAKVLQGIYQASDGKILINEQAQNNFSIKSILEHVTYISQEPVLFNRSIKENINYLNDEIDDKSLAKITQVALCDDFINKLSQKYDTQLSNLGNNISAGQKQRVAIARALCSKAKWLILDEPSSALDIATESKLIKNLLTYCKNRTLIIITHNPTIMKSMDKIIYLEDGCIVAEGSHNELIKKSNLYKSFIKRITND